MLEGGVSEAASISLLPKVEESSQVLDRVEREREPEEKDGSPDLRSDPVSLGIRRPAQDEHSNGANNHADLCQDQLILVSLTSGKSGGDDDVRGILAGLGRLYGD